MFQYFRHFVFSDCLHLSNCFSNYIRYLLLIFYDTCCIFWPAIGCCILQMLVYLCFFDLFVPKSWTEGRKSNKIEAKFSKNSFLSLHQPLVEDFIPPKKDFISKNVFFLWKMIYKRFGAISKNNFLLNFASFFFLFQFFGVKNIENVGWNIHRHCLHNNVRGRAKCQVCYLHRLWAADDIKWPFTHPTTPPNHPLFPTISLCRQIFDASILNIFFWLKFCCLNYVLKYCRFNFTATILPFPKMLRTGPGFIL